MTVLFAFESYNIIKSAKGVEGKINLQIYIEDTNTMISSDYHQHIIIIFRLLTIDSYIAFFHHLHEQYCPSDPKKLMVTSGHSQVHILDGVHVVSNYKGTNTSCKILLDVFHC